MGKLQAYTDSGTVAFSSVLRGWGFPLTTFIKMYSAKLKMEKKK